MAALLGLMCRSWCLVAAAASGPEWGVCSLSGTAVVSGAELSWERDDGTTGQNAEEKRETETATKHPDWHTSKHWEEGYRTFGPPPIDQPLLAASTPARSAGFRMARHRKTAKIV
ncbi:hypothetical protein B0I37DRAFT_349504 [Chaetomium sp. MPI-CAGE-AT-0009]|nr:hypothetical protein B0I37DRAFT_349504 [Chaetomium sp. MPI-CAGE-AT-0009]